MRGGGEKAQLERDLPVARVMADSHQIVLALLRRFRRLGPATPDVHETPVMLKLASELLPQLSGSSVSTYTCYALALIA